jgi:hypothetical protein
MLLTLATFKSEITPTQKNCVFLTTQFDKTLYQRSKKKKKKKRKQRKKEFEAWLKW